MFRWLLAVVAVGGIVVGVLIGALNPEPVALNLVIGEWNVSLGIVVVACFCAGLALGAVVGFVLRLAGRAARTPVTGKDRSPGKSLENA